MKIRVLDDRVIDQIAAGEVVERPASALKELFENALDAGATKITVRLKNGGMSLIQITDDGCGMSRGDAMLCIERHATSKIRSTEDLVGVRTLGFRGEAMPSIASVSRFEIKTREATSEVGTRVVVEGGVLKGVFDSGGLPGTEVSVRSLFFNLPARRKFLRTRQTEMAHCLEAVHREALRRPDVEITVFHEGRQVLKAPRTDDPVARVRDVLGEDAKALIEVEHAARGVHVSGLLSPPAFHRPTSNGGVYLYVNDRYVRDPVVRRAVTEAYRGLLPKGRYPVVVLSVTVDDESVDVNVHPAKTEVRFRDPKAVAQVAANAMREALREATRQVNWGPAPAPKPSAPAPAPQLPLGGQPELAAKPSVAAHPDDDPRLRGVKELSPSPAPVASTPVAPSKPMAPSMPATPVAEPALAPVPEPVSSPVTPAPQPMPSVVLAPTVVADTPEPVGFRSLRPLWTSSEGILLATHGDDLWALDIPAIERSRVLALWKQLRAAGDVPTQSLLLPHVCALSRQQVSVLVARAEALSALGLELTAFGPGEIAVMSTPEVAELVVSDTLVHGLASPRAADAQAWMTLMLDHLAPPELADLYACRQYLATLEEDGELTLGAPWASLVDPSALVGQGR